MAIVIFQVSGGSAFAEEAGSTATLASQETVARPADEGAVGEIVVTAQKREQAINDVPMSITAATGDQLAQVGVKEVADLVKITPGLNVGTTTKGTPVFTLRGVGYNDFALSTRPSVTVYLDEALIPASHETKGVGLDVERVEVLKGPQGTLFGNNSTGGLINYVANKPTDEFHAGGSLEYGRFNAIDAQAFISGPIAPTLSARLALQIRRADGWQRSYTRDQSLGEVDFANGRLIVAWEPDDRFRASVTLSHWRDKSETYGSQYYRLLPNVPSLLSLTGLQNYPLAPNDNRATDWDPERDMHRNDKFFQATARLEYDLSDSLTLTSISSYLNFDLFAPFDNDATTLDLIPLTQIASAKGYAEELRLSWDKDPIRLVIGATYNKDRVRERNVVHIGDSTVSYSFTSRGPKWTGFEIRKDERIETYAAFANAEYSVTSDLTVQAGIRYTNMKNRFAGCTADPGDNGAAIPYTLLANQLRAARGLPPIPQIPAGGCIIFNSNIEPVLVRSELKEDSISWRVGAQYELASGTLLYANVSKGYKQGGYPSLSATFVPGIDPATQESVLAYEAGFKASIMRQLQINGAVFYYDYTDKQVVGTVRDPIFGPVAKPVNVPKSRITGVELQVIASPLAGLTLNLGGSYTGSKVTASFPGTNSIGVATDFKGSPLPDVTEWQLNGDVEYRWSVKDNLDAFVGAHAYYQSETWPSLGQVDVLRLKPYTIVDARAGIEGADGQWQAYVWGRNIFNELYYVSSARLVDNLVRWAGRPVTYGVTVSTKF
ncbi:MAG: TonB-dependent receptor [Sphingobium sp.]